MVASSSRSLRKWPTRWICTRTTSVLGDRPGLDHGAVGDHRRAGGGRDRRAGRGCAGLPGAGPRLVDCRAAPRQILGVSPTLDPCAHPGTARNPSPRTTLSGLRILASTGEAWDPESWRWLFEKAGGERCPIINISGGTEVGACLLSPLPITPLKPCSLVGPALGMAVDVFDAAGKPLREGVGELVCTKPWPAMTRGIWGTRSGTWPRTGRAGRMSGCTATGHRSTRTATGSCTAAATTR